MPPECDICGRRPEPDADGLDGFTTLAFADYEPLPEGMTGHPKGLHWLCAQHARALAEHTDLPWSVAKSRLRRLFATLAGEDAGSEDAVAEEVQPEDDRPSDETGGQPAIEGLGRVVGLDLVWPDGDGTAGVHLHEGELVWWSRPGGAGGRFGEAARTQGRADYVANGPAVACPADVEAEVDRALGRDR